MINKEKLKNFLYYIPPIIFFSTLLFMHLRGRYFKSKIEESACFTVGKTTGYTYGGKGTMKLIKYYYIVDGVYYKDKTMNEHKAIVPNGTCLVQYLCARPDYQIIYFDKPMP